ncbi:hypothetical protein [Roseicyclus sp.]|uniref:hypothetical protein n=1 Tax=Roseicyclus sp. TaxID=1914329 RepID=UPI003FA0AE9E
MRLLGVGYLSIGVIFGVCAATTILAFAPSGPSLNIGLPSIPHPEVWASVLGALVGGLISALVAQSSFEKATIRELSRDEAERKSVRRAQAYSLLLKLRMALNHVQKAHNYYRTFEASSVVQIQRINIDSGAAEQVAQIWQPLQGKRKEVNLGIGEQAFLLEEGAIKLFNIISDLEGALSNCEFIEEKYREFFFGFIERQIADGDYRTEGKLITSSGRPDEFGLLRASDALEKLRASIVPTLPLLYEAISLATGLIEERFGEKIQMEFDREIRGVADYA